MNGGAAGVRTRLRRVLQAVRSAFGRAPAEPEPDVYEDADFEGEEGANEPLSFIVSDLYHHERARGTSSRRAVREVARLCDSSDTEVRRLIDDERVRTDRAIAEEPPA